LLKFTAILSPRSKAWRFSIHHVLLIFLRAHCSSSSAWVFTSSETLLTGAVAPFRLSTDEIWCHNGLSLSGRYIPHLSSSKRAPFSLFFSPPSADSSWRDVCLSVVLCHLRFVFKRRGLVEQARPCFFFHCSPRLLPRRLISSIDHKMQVTVKQGLWSTVLPFFS